MPSSPNSLEAALFPFNKKEGQRKKIADLCKHDTGDLDVELRAAASEADVQRF